jgi:septum formation protein
MGTASIWCGRDPLLLASTSATRRALLESIGLPVETEAPGVDERAVEAELQADGAAPVDIARRLASEKAIAVSRRHPERLVLGGDQVLALGLQVFGKPADRAAARTQLLALSGRTHRLHTAVALASGGAVVRELLESPELTMRVLESDAIDRYLMLAGETVTQSVGAYQIEGVGLHLFREVRGDHATILGLPLRRLLKALRALGCLAL